MEYCCGIWTGASQYSLSCSDQDQKRLCCLVRDKLISSDEFTICIAYVRGKLIPWSHQFITSQLGSKDATYTVYSFSFHLCPIGNVEVPHRNLIAMNSYMLKPSP